MTKSSLQPWQVRASRHIHKDRWVSLRADDCVTAEGVEIAPFYVLDNTNTVQIIALDTSDNVILTRQYRHGMGVLSLELPCGRMEPHEQDPLDTAARELLEETGYAADHLRLIASLSPNPANHSGLAHFVLAERAAQVQAPQPEPTENIEILPTHYREALELAMTGAIVQSIHVGALVMALRAAGKIVLQDR